MMKKRIAALVTAGVLALSMLTGCGSKQESWKVTCPWAPSGVAAMVSQKAAAKSPDYSDNKITLVAEAVKGDAATVNTWVSSTKANDKELVFAGEGLFAITETLDPAKLQFSYDDFEFVENLYSSVFVLSADSSLNLKNLDDLEAYVKAGNPVSVAVNGATGSEAFLAAALFGSMGAGDHSTTFPTLRGISKYIDGNIGVIHIDRHSDCDAIQMDEKMHGTEWYHSTHLPNLSAKNLVQIGIGGNCCKSWSKFTRDSGCTAISMEDIDKYGIDKVAELALDIAWKGCKAVYVSLDIDVLEAAFCPGTGTPDFGGMLPRELLRLLKLVTAPGICGMDVVEVSPPFDVSEITSLAASRCIINVLCNLALNKSLYKH